MSKSQERPPDSTPKLRGEELYIPFVGAIITRDGENGTEILIQERDNQADPIYKGSIEIPGGKFRAFEDVYESLKREVREEAGIELISVEDESGRVDVTNRNHTSSLIQPFCVTQMIEGPFIGLIFLCKAKDEPVKKTNETKEAKWVLVDDLREIVKNEPEKIFTAFLAPLKKFLQVS